MSCVTDRTIPIITAKVIIYPKFSNTSSKYSWRSSTTVFSINESDEGIQVNLILMISTKINQNDLFSNFRIKLLVKKSKILGRFWASNKLRTEIFHWNYNAKYFLFSLVKKLWHFPNIYLRQNCYAKLFWRQIFWSKAISAKYLIWKSPAKLDFIIGVKCLFGVKNVLPNLWQSNRQTLYLW